VAVFLSVLKDAFQSDTFLRYIRFRMAKRLLRKGSSSSSDRRYPRPQLQREQWISLNGRWDFHIDSQGKACDCSAITWDEKIQVPFSPETPASGVNNSSFYEAVWYRREFEAPELQGEQRLVLHFGAVDYQATVWINGRHAINHEGGYTPFRADITDLLNRNGVQTIVVRAEDSPHDLAKPRGKQDWQLHPHSIWYPRTTGIWQTVWMEVVQTNHIESMRWTPNIESWELALDVRIAGAIAQELELEVELSVRGRKLAHDTYRLHTHELCRKIALSDPGIDDYRNEMLWYPHSPVLIDAKLTLRDAKGNTLDDVVSYAAMRSLSVLGDRLVLNGKPYYLQLVLDQGYWPESGLTAPDDEALRKDVELVKAMGFNGVRKHQKIEDPRFLYWADHLGLLVWQEMPSCYRFSQESVHRLTKQWAEAIARDCSHPCVVAYVPFNESWGVPDLPDSPAQRHCVQALYHLTKTLDPTRPVVGNDGWEAAATDLIGIHDYDHNPQRIAQRYSTESGVDRLLHQERPGHKILMLAGFTYQGQPILLTEFGGIAFSKDQKRTWGYSRAGTADDFASRYAHLLSAVRSSPLLAGFCYTQFTDTYQEANGLLYMDRTPKFPIEQIACATRGPQSPKDQQIISRWRAMVNKRMTELEKSTLNGA